MGQDDNGESESAKAGGGFLDICSVAAKILRRGRSPRSTSLTFKVLSFAGTGCQ